MVQTFNSQVYKKCSVYRFLGTGRNIAGGRQKSRGWNLLYREIRIDIRRNIWKM